MMMDPLPVERAALIRAMVMRAELGPEKKEREPRKGLGPNAGILLSVVIIGFGIFLLIFNWGSPYKEITGNILSVTDTSPGLYIQLSNDPNDLYAIDTSTLHPSWAGPFIEGARVDVYYNSYIMPKRIVALQTYDLSGHPTIKYTTTEYTDSVNPSPFSNTGRDFGAVVILLGLLWAGREVFLKVRASRQLTD